MKSVKILLTLTLVFFSLTLTRDVLRGQAGEEIQKLEKALQQFLSTDFLNAENCERYKDGEKKHNEARSILLKVGAEILPELLGKLGGENGLEEVQSEWLFSLSEEICGRNSAIASYLVENHPDYYELIAVCRTKEAMQHLADEAESIKGPSALEFIINLFSDEDEYDSALSDEEKENYKLLLIFLAVDGEHNEALNTLKNQYEEGLFLAASRLMEMQNKPFVEKPFLSDEYRNEVLESLSSDEDSTVLGMVLGDKGCTKRIRDKLLNIDISSIPEAKIDRELIIFIWYLQVTLEQGLLDEEIFKKYSDLALYYKADTVEIRRLLGKACSSSKDFATQACKLLDNIPSLMTTDPVELCLYPELQCCSQTEMKQKEDQK